MHIHQDSQRLEMDARRHHHVYTESELTRMIRQAGFEVRQIPFIYRPSNPITALASRIPPIPQLLNTRTHWRNFLGWKA